MKTILIIVITLIGGILIGKYSFSTHEVVIRSETIPIQSGKEKQLDSLTEDFYNLSQSEFKNYINLKDQKEKFEKAEEILGKVILLFLANVQMKMENNVQSYFTEKDRKNPVEKIVTIEKKKEKGPDVFTNEFVGSKMFKDVDPRFKDIQRKFPLEIKSPYLYFKNAKSEKNTDNISVFNGRFKGDLNIVSEKKKGEVHSVELLVSFQDDSGKISGNYESKLSYEGNIYSHNRGSGYNGQIKRAKGSRLFMVQTSPNSFFHLKYIDSEDYFIGKYYDDDEYKGLVVLYPVR